MGFLKLELDTKWAEALRSQGITEPTAIQKEVFKPIVEGRSVLGLSKTGTGKTLAYMAPLLQRYFLTSQSAELPQKIIVLVPTRELAFQVLDTLHACGEKNGSGVVIVGGESEEKQISAANTARWIIATPGRLLDLLGRKLVDPREVKALVYDEADRLLDMGFIDDIRAIVEYLPKGMQMLFFSATLHFGVDEMAYEMGIEFLRFGQESEKVTVEGLDHRVAFVGDDEKFHALANFVFEREKSRGIVFSNYRERAHEISSRLRGLGYRVEGLTAQLPQNARSKIMEAFRAGHLQLLIASDLAARGLDVDDIDYVVNFDLPEDPATYVHRVGRTARAGRDGMALSLIGFEDAFRLEKLEKFLGHPVPRFAFDVEKFRGPLPRVAGAPQPSRPAAASHAPRDHRPQRQAPRNNPSPQNRSVPAPQKPSVNPVPAAPKAVPASLLSRLWKSVLAFFGRKPVVPAAAAAPRPSGPRHSGGRAGVRGDRRRGERALRSHSGPSSASRSSSRMKRGSVPRGRS